VEIGEDLCSKQELLTEGHYGGEKHCPLLACVFIAEVFLIRIAGRAPSPRGMFLCPVYWFSGRTRLGSYHNIGLKSPPG
jgi:hypothetical protein